MSETIIGQPNEVLPGDEESRFAGVGGAAGQQLLVAAPPPPADVVLGLFGPRTGYFYPSFSFGGSTIEFTDPVNDVSIQDLPIGGMNVSLNGNSETLQVRVETQLTLSFMTLDPTLLNQLRDWWRGWAMVGKQTAITLDRLGTCAGQWEFDTFNTFFTRAVCLRNPFPPKRLAPGRQLFVVQIVVRQDQASPLDG